MRPKPRSCVAVAITAVVATVAAACSHSASAVDGAVKDAGTRADAATGDAAASPSDAQPPDEASDDAVAASAPEQLMVIPDAVGLAASGSEIFVSTYASGVGGQVYRFDAKPNATRKLLVSKHPHPGLMHFDPFPISTALLWVDLDEKALYTVDVSGGGMRDLYPSEMPHRPQGLGALAGGQHDGNGFYFVWTDPVAGDILSYQVVNGFIAHNQQGAMGITLHRTGSGAQDPADYAIWTRPPAGEISRAGLTASAGSDGLLFTNEAEPYGITCDDQFLYWTNRGDGTIVRATIDGQNRTVLATDQDTPTGIDVDGTYVYWVNAGDGSIMRVAK